MSGGQQYIVVSAGGRSGFSPDLSDAVLAYKLKHRSSKVEYYRFLPHS